MGLADSFVEVNKVRLGLGAGANRDCGRIGGKRHGGAGGGCWLRVKAKGGMDLARELLCRRYLEMDRKRSGKLETNVGVYGLCVVN